MTSSEPENKAEGKESGRAIVLELMMEKTRSTISICHSYARRAVVFRFWEDSSRRLSIRNIFEQRFRLTLRHACRGDRHPVRPKVG